ncbi:hypothetical protein GGI12_002526 [Dipsacomyces acuminosporus]|nr:hypothetical protein GGI12_002526 [Dipsacomyces acuminosporus]
MSAPPNADIEYIEFGVPGDKVPVPRIGLGCMGLSTAYGSTNEEESLEVLRHSLDIGCTFWDTADIYGVGANERLLSQVLRHGSEKVFVCTKYGFEFEEPETGGALFHKHIKGVNGSPEYIKKAVDASLRRLGINRIDLYYQHRVDPNVPIEETVRAMAELVKEGKVRYLGLSECSAETLRRAYKVHPIAAVQYEYNAWSVDLETNGLLDACRELGVTLVAYSPLGRGFLTGQLRKYEDLEEDDVRRNHPRFQPENFDNNLKLVEAFEAIAGEKGCTTSQLALAWVLAQEKNLIVIPGTKRTKYLDSNFAAGKVKLTEEDLKEIRAVIDSVPVVGLRYPETLMKLLNH